MFRHQAVLMDFGSVREARVHITSRAEALILQVAHVTCNALSLHAAWHSGLVRIAV